MESYSLFHGNIIEADTVMMKNTGNISVNIPTLIQRAVVHYKLCFLHITHACPYDRQSSHTSFTMTVTLFIQVTQKPHLHMKTSSLTKDIPVTLCFHDSFMVLLGSSTIIPGYLKSYIGYI